MGSLDITTFAATWKVEEVNGVTLQHPTVAQQRIVPDQQKIAL